ncbi:MAG TPA: hypothetical protein PK297_04215 [Spirochaetota bacterium]|nr:hypothetical protein [Spirochaetota bacterium]
MNRFRWFLLVCIAGSLTGAEMVYQMVTTLPPLFSGVEANSTATLQMLIDEQTTIVTNRADANRIVRKDMLVDKAAESGQGTGKWLLAKLTRYYDACLAVKDTLELYTPAAEYKALLTDGERYGAEWQVTLQTIALARWNFSDLPKTAEAHAPLAGAARRLYPGIKPLAVQ